MSHPFEDEFQQAARIQQPSDDRFSLASLKAQYDLDAFSIISDTSIFNRKNSITLDYTNYLASLFYDNPYQYASNDVPSPSYLVVEQHSITQETRLQSNTKDALIDWTAGFYYSWSKQAEQQTYINGQHDIEEILGTSLLPGRVGELLFLNAYDQQISGYGSVDINVTDQIKLTLGLRVSDMDFTFNELGEGPVNGGTTYNAGSEHETPVTPRFSLSYQPDNDNFLYVTVAEGFRPGGAQAPAPAAFCASDLHSLGLTDSPSAYQSDSVWSYELGAKDTLLDGRLYLDSSVYLVKWQNIEQSVYLPDCGFNYVVNLGSATSVGGDVSARFKVTPNLLVGVNAGYDDVTVDQTNYGGGGSILAVQGQRIGGPPLTATLWGQYNFTVFDNRDAFYRMDYTFQSHGPSLNPRDYSYDPGIPSLKATSYLSLRAGVFIDSWEVSAFVNNATNEETPTSIAHDLTNTPLYYNSSNRPVTFGTMVEYRF
jgi:outer membrane receptor protein involved in Fe transport